MEISIIHHQEDNTYTWILRIGEDLLDEYSGVQLSLGQCFEEIVKHRIIHGIHSLM